MTKLQELTVLHGGTLKPGTRLRATDGNYRDLIYVVDQVLPEIPGLYLQRYLLIGEEGGSDIVAVQHVEERYSVAK